MASKDPFVYGVQATGANRETDFIAVISKDVLSKDELLQTLSGSLQFPDYFGSNWDALSDCLRDFSWIDKRRVMVVHEDVPQLDKQELAAYLEVLSESVEDWKPGENHELVVVFPESAREKILEVLRT